MDGYVLDETGYAVPYPPYQGKESIQFLYFRTNKNGSKKGVSKHFSHGASFIVFLYYASINEVRMNALI